MDAHEAQLLLPNEVPYGDLDDTTLQDLVLMNGDPFIMQNAMSELHLRSSDDPAIRRILREVVDVVLNGRVGDTHHRAAAWRYLYALDRLEVTRRVLQASTPFESSCLAELVTEFSADLESQGGQSDFDEAAEKLAAQLRGDPEAREKLWDQGKSILSRS